MRKIYIILTVLTVAIFATSCQDLEIENLNGPDKARALANGNDLYGIAGSTLNTIWLATQNYEGLPLALSVMSDQMTCSWGNSGMRDCSYEPRIAFNNTATYAYASHNERIWNYLYGALSSANEVLAGIANGTDVGTNGVNNELVKAWCYFIQGMTVGYLALTYDQLYIIDETTDPNNLNLSGYKDGIAAAIVSLNKTIQICGANTFTLDPSWVPGQTYTNVQLAALANTMAARLLVYSSRTAAENTAVNWNTVLDYVNKGIAMDFAPQGDDQIWYADYKTYSCLDGWLQVDMRIINLMDPNMPARFPASGLISDLPNNGLATSNDARLLSDFTYKASCPFNASRGYYHFSTYKLAKYDYHTNTLTGPMPEIFAYENDLLKAEALVRTGAVPSAVAILNAGNRNSRGHLPALETTITAVKALEIIFYEREIDLIGSGYGLGWMDMRRRDLLQKGSLLHFPIPGQQLEVLQIDYYTFGGVSNADGTNTSNGGWF